MSQNKLSIGRLPKKTIERFEALVERSSPNPVKPPLPEGMETRLALVEKRTAACYAGMEEMTYRIQQAAKRIDPDLDAEDSPLPELPNE